jgi:flagellar protein FliL
MAEEPKDTSRTEVPKKKARSKFILIMLIIMLLLAACAGAGYFMFGDKILNRLHPAQAIAAVKKKHEVGPIIALEPFVFNLSGNYSKYAKVSLGIEVKDPKVQEEAKKMVPALRDRVLSVLGSKAAEVLMDVGQRETLKKEVYEGLKGLFKEGKEGSELQAVYITDIIIQ